MNENAKLARVADEFTPLVFSIANMVAAIPELGVRVIVAVGFQDAEYVCPNTSSLMSPMLALAIGSQPDGEIPTSAGLLAGLFAAIQSNMKSLGFVPGGTAMSKFGAAISVAANDELRTRTKLLELSAEAELPSM